MAETTEIAWTDSTFNPWWGCTRIAPGCNNCYAAALDKRTGGNYWDNKQPPRITSPQNWAKPKRWNNAAKSADTRHKVFCGSMCDVFDNNALTKTRTQLWELISQTPFLDWQLLTKRPTNINKFLPKNWGEGYANVWLGVTVENKQHGLPRLDVLKQIPAQLRFLSIEPLLENIGDIDLQGISWVIVGGESGPKARPMNIDWVQDILSQCRDQHVPFFFKQHGGAARNKGGCLIDGAEIKQWPI